MDSDDHFVSGELDGPTAGAEVSQLRLHAEVQMEISSTVDENTVRRWVEDFFRNRAEIQNDALFVKGSFGIEDLERHVRKITVSFDASRFEILTVTPAVMSQLRIHVYRVFRSNPFAEISLGRDGETGDGNVIGMQRWDLPSEEFEDFWDNLIFEDGLKEKVMKYVETMMVFADLGVSPSKVSSNRLLLFHGPPGTGKTTFCKAIAQKAFIRLSERYDMGQLIEVNSHSLFSKWFSESGKMVLKLFDTIKALLQDERCVTFVLIDEIESLTTARRNALSGNDPSDALRVVNALLTQLDAIRRYSNVLLLSTSNITDALDSAFVDRADIKQYIGRPVLNAVYEILRGSVLELQRCNILYADMIPQPLDQLLTPQQKASHGASDKLLDIARRGIGLSGRSLKKLPLLAHTLCKQHVGIPTMTFLDALQRATDKHMKDGELMDSSFTPLSDCSDKDDLTNSESCRCRKRTE